MNHMITFLWELSFIIQELCRYLSQFVGVSYLMLEKVLEINILLAAGIFREN